jgi:hypothetical protein
MRENESRGRYSHNTRVSFKVKEFLFFIIEACVLPVILTKAISRTHTHTLKHTLTVQSLVSQSLHLDRSSLELSYDVSSVAELFSQSLR